VRERERERERERNGIADGSLMNVLGLSINIRSKYSLLDAAIGGIKPKD
jgi:hypothetical protein